MMNRASFREAFAKYRDGQTRLGVADVVAGVWFGIWGGLTSLVIVPIPGVMIGLNLTDNWALRCIAFGPAFFVALFLGRPIVQKHDLPLVKHSLLGAVIALLALPLLLGAMCSRAVMMSLASDGFFASLSDTSSLVIGFPFMLSIALVVIGPIIAPMGAIAAILLRLLSKPYREKLSPSAAPGDHCSPSL